MSNQTVHFSGIREKIIETLNTANKEVLIAVAWFTDEKIIEVLNKLSNRDISISIIIYDDKINNKDLFKTLYYQKADIRVSKKLMHNKFCIIDSNVVINGSYNWTYNASTNHENIQITRYNVELIETFVEEFYKLKANCKKLENHFLHNIEKISYELEKFERYFYLNIENLNKTPYFYKINDIQNNTLHKQIKLKEGIIIIKDKNQEFVFFKLLYFFRKDFPLNETLKFSNENLIIPEVYDSIKDINFDNTYEIKSRKFISINNTRKFCFNRREYYVSDISLIGANGDIINKVLKCEIKPSGFYVVDLKFFYDKDLNKVPTIGEVVVYIDYLGYINKTEDGYGLWDFNGINLVENKFNLYYIIDNNIIEFIELPYSKLRYSDYYKKNVVERCYGDARKCYDDFKIFEDEKRNKQFFERDNLNATHKKHLFNIKTKELNEIKLLKNKSDDLEENIFLSDNSYKNIHFIKIFVGSNVLYSKYKYYLSLYEYRLTRLSEVQKEKFARQLFDEYQVLLKNEEQQKRDSEKFCYIATMVYEDINHPKVQRYRDFRDSVLKNYIFGKFFIRCYYKYSPMIVEKLENQKVLNKIVRAFLDLLLNIINAFFDKRIKNNL